MSDRIVRLRELLAKSTGGEWSVLCAAVIVAAVNALPQLLAIAEALRRTVCHECRRPIGSNLAVFPCKVCDDARAALAKLETP